MLQRGVAEIIIEGWRLERDRNYVFRQFMLTIFNKIKLLGLDRQSEWKDSYQEC